MSGDPTGAGAAGFGARGRVLESYLERLRRNRTATAIAEGHAGGATKLSSRQLVADEWAADKVERFFEQTGPEADPCAVLVAHGVALVDKCVADLRRLRQGQLESGSRVFALQAELMLDTAVGTALVRETQSTIDLLLKIGRLDEARRLSKFHHRLRNSVLTVRKTIDAAERERAESLADQLADLPRSDPRRARRGTAPRGTPPAPVEDRPSAPVTSIPTARTSPAVERAPRAERRTRPATSARASARSWGSTRLFAVLLLVSALLWLASARQGTPHGSQTVPEIELIAPLLAVQDRRPSLFVEVDGDAWSKLPETDRLARVEELGRYATRLGYVGVSLRSGDGRTVARWLKQEGAGLLGQEEWEPPPDQVRAPRDPGSAQ